MDTHLRIFNQCKKGLTKMNLQEIKTAVDNDKTVNWKTPLYRVIRDDKGQYFITCSSSNNLVGLTWMDETTMNGEEKDFFVKGEQTPTK